MALLEIGKKLTPKTEIFIGDNVKIGDIVLPAGKIFSKSNLNSLLIEKNENHKFKTRLSTRKSRKRNDTRRTAPFCSGITCRIVAEKSGMTMVKCKSQLSP